MGLMNEIAVWVKNGKDLTELYAAYRNRVPQEIDVDEPQIQELLEALQYIEYIFTQKTMEEAGWRWTGNAWRRV